MCAYFEHLNIKVLRIFNLFIYCPILLTIFMVNANSQKKYYFCLDTIEHPIWSISILYNLYKIVLHLYFVSQCLGKCVIPKFSLGIRLNSDLPRFKILISAKELSASWNLNSNNSIGLYLILARLCTLLYSIQACINVR